MPDYDYGTHKGRNTPCFSEVYYNIHAAANSPIVVYCRHEPHQAMYAINCKFTRAEVSQYTTALLSMGFDITFEPDAKMDKTIDAYSWTFDPRKQSQISRLMLLNGLRYLWEDFAGGPKIVRAFLDCLNESNAKLTPLELFNLWLQCHHAITGGGIHDTVPYYGIFRAYESQTALDEFFENMEKVTDTRQYMKQVGSKAPLHDLFRTGKATLASIQAEYVKQATPPATEGKTKHPYTGKVLHGDDVHLRTFE